MAKKWFSISTLGLLLLVFASQGIPQAAPTGASEDSPVDMALIPAGEFWMGRTHAFAYDEVDWAFRPHLDDWPAHVVLMDAYSIDKYEITNEDYARFAKVTEHRKPWQWQGGEVPAGREKWPVYNVSWDDALAYCTWVGKRLPTEAEWEKAARGGLDRKLYPWGNELGGPGIRTRQSYDTTDAPKLAHYLSAAPAPVGSYEPNGYALYDMTGNVWEWVADWYHRDYYVGSPEKNPRGPETGVYRVFRGGGWPNRENYPKRSTLGVNFRNYTDAWTISPAIGFRCATSVEAPVQAQR